MMDDASAIQQVQEGNSEPFSGLMEGHLARVRAWVALRVPRAHLIDEIAHETFVYAYLNIRKFRRGASFRGWLLAIAMNLIRREVLRHARDRAHQAEYSRRRGPAVAPSAELQLDLGGLEPLLHLRYGLGYGPREIAERLGRSPGWVRCALFRLRQKLRRRGGQSLALLCR